MEFYLHDSAATEALGRLLGKHAASGDVFCLSGDLGAGKTLLSRGVAVALGAEAEDVNSPTFAIMNVYQGRELEIRHFDLYRLNRPEELEDIGFEEYAGGDGVTLIEWLSCSRRSCRRNICRLLCCMMVKAVVPCCRLRVKDMKNCCGR